MGRISLNDITITTLSCISTKGGDVLHALKLNDVGYAGFGEAYFSWVSVGSVKAWKRHTRMTMNLVVPVGQVQFVFRLDDVDQFRIEEIGVNRYVRITVPPGVWFGFKGLSAPQSLVLNLANIVHDPNEIERHMLSIFKYDWN
jgi:dTDP-4-dehydrorhamnose 3,5-epimerase